jgi:hypothetical protein
MRTDLHRAQRRQTLTRALAQKRGCLAEIGDPTTRHHRRTITMAQKVIRRSEAELALLEAEAARSRVLPGTRHIRGETSAKSRQFWRSLWGK